MNPSMNDSTPCPGSFGAVIIFIRLVLVYRFKKYILSISWHTLIWHLKNHSGNIVQQEPTCWNSSLLIVCKLELPVNDSYYLQALLSLFGILFNLLKFFSVPLTDNYERDLQLNRTKTTQRFPLPVWKLLHIPNNIYFKSCFFKKKSKVLSALLKYHSLSSKI